MHSLRKGMRIGSDNQLKGIQEMIAEIIINSSNVEEVILITTGLKMKWTDSGLKLDIEIGLSLEI